MGRKRGRLFAVLLAPADAIWGQAKSGFKRKQSRIWFLITQTGSNMVTAQKQSALFVSLAMISITMIKLGNVLQDFLWQFYSLKVREGL